MTDAWTTLPGLHAMVWQTLQRGVADRHATARHLSFATVAPDGAPEVRTVVLRAADPAKATLDIHTDIRSAKVAALRAQPKAEAMVWDATTKLQIRLSGPVDILTGDSAAAEWARVPDTSRVSYGNLPGPGVPIAGALDHAPGDGEAVFAILRMSVTQIDALHLGDRHRRARFRRIDGWAVEWLSP